MFSNIEKKLKQELSVKRYEHSMRVAETAEQLAAANGYEPQRAYLAGLLHDCARDLTDEKLQRYVAEHKLKVKKYDLQYPTLLHAAVSADLAEKKYGIEDKEVLEAVQRHTAGGRNMLPIVKVVYVADFIEPGRPGATTNIIRNLANKSLNKAVLEKARYMLEFSKRIKEKLHPEVLATIEHYKNV